MQRLTLALVMTAIFVGGLLVGSFTTPAARSQTIGGISGIPSMPSPAPIPPAVYGGAGTPVPPTSYGPLNEQYAPNLVYQTGRWQIFSFVNANPPVNQSAYLVILLDAQSGDSYLLRPDITQTSATWVRIDRR